MNDYLIIILFALPVAYVAINFLWHKLYYYWPNNNPYKIFTTEFDQISYAADIPEIITNISLDYENGHCSEDSTLWVDNIAASQTIFEELSVEYADDIQDDINFSDTAIIFLLDQSGSMRGNAIQQLAAAIKLMAVRLNQKNIPFEILGFSTAGWHGGFARKKWKSRFNFKRPGRLCALHHIIYNEFDMPMKQAAWEVMLHPDILRENIDGEALLWASERLRKRNEKRKILIGVTDGAPVDDSTLLNNGPDILFDHYQLVAEQLRADNDIIYAELGIESDRSENYDLYDHVYYLENIYPQMEALLKNAVSKP